MPGPCQTIPVSRATFFIPVSMIRLSLSAIILPSLYSAHLKSTMLISSPISEHGSTVNAGFYEDRRDKLTRKVHWQ